MFVQSSRGHIDKKLLKSPGSDVTYRRFSYKKVPLEKENGMLGNSFCVYVPRH